MKDPLNPERTPYEVLGIERGASPASEHEANKRQRAAGVKAEDLQWARAALKDPERMALFDLFEYDAELFSRLNLSARDLALASRERTREHLESELKNWINQHPRDEQHGAEVGHALFVLSYFSGFARRAEPGSDPFQRQLWQRTIGYLGFLCTNAESLFEKCGDEPLRRRIEEQLLAREHAGATGYDELRAMIPVELRAARELRSHNIAGGIGFGPLLAETLGFRSALSDAISNQQRRSPAHEGLRFLAAVFKGLGAVYALRERRDFGGALAALERLPPPERSTDEVENARAEILFELGKTLAADVAAHNETQVMDAWEAACTAARSQALRREIEAEVETYSVRRATELSRFQVKDAVALLRRARRSADTSKVCAGLVNMLRQYAHEVHEAGERGLAERLLAEARQVSPGAVATPPPTAPAARATPRPPTPGGGQSARPDRQPAPPPPPVSPSSDPVFVARSLRESGQPEMGVQILGQIGPHLTGVQAVEARRELAACLAAKVENDIDRLLAAVNVEQGPNVESWQELEQGVERAHAELRRATQLDPQNQHVARTLERLTELRELMNPEEQPPPPPPVTTVPPGSVAVRRSPTPSAGRYRSPGHIATLLLAFIAAGAASWWLVRSPEPWVDAVRHQASAFRVLTPLVDTYGPRLLWTVAAALLLAPAGLGWLSESAKSLLQLFAYPFVVRWNRKGPFGRIVEYWLLASVAGVLFLAGQALHGRFRPGALPAGRAPASVAVAPKPREPAAPRTATGPEQQRVSKLLAEVSKLDATGASALVSELEQKRVPSAASERADDFVLAAALEQSRETERAKATYKKLVPGADAYARSSQLRLIELGVSKKPAPEAYGELAAERGEGWFKTKTAWKAGVLEQQVARHRMEAQSSKPSVRLLSAIRERAPVPAERAYWFVFGALVLAFKLVTLPLAWKSSEAVARLRSLEPQRRALMARFADDAQARGLAVMEFYRKHNVNFFSGCLNGLLEFGIVIWALFAMTTFAPQWDIDGARFFWLNDITLWDYRVAGLWIACQVLVALPAYRQNDSDPTARVQLIGAFVIPLVMAAVAFYFKLPACVFIFLTLLSLTSLVLRTSLSKIQSLRYG